MCCKKFRCWLTAASLSTLRRPVEGVWRHRGDDWRRGFLVQSKYSFDEDIMRGTQFRPQPSDGGGGNGRDKAATGGAVRRRDGRWGWTRSSHLGREQSDWVVIWLRSRWRRS